MPNSKPQCQNVLSNWQTKQPKENPSTNKIIQRAPIGTNVSDFMRNPVLCAQCNVESKRAIWHERQFCDIKILNQSKCKLNMPNKCPPRMPFAKHRVRLWACWFREIKLPQIVEGRRASLTWTPILWNQNTKQCYQTAKQSWWRAVWLCARSWTSANDCANFSIFRCLLPRNGSPAISLACPCELQTLSPHHQCARFNVD